MRLPMTRRSMLAGSASLLALGTSLPAFAQAKPKLKLSLAASENDLRAEGFKAFAAGMKDDFEPYWTNTLFKQGTELVALQRENLELCNLAPADISKQIPAWSLMTSAYLFRDYAHLRKTFQSDVGKDFINMARDQLGIELIRPVYFGARQVNLKPTKKINTPADMAGLKLRMPPGEFWQFLGESLGANPTPVAYAELYTALQAGAVDGQDNPLVAGRTMKFYEVTSQFILTNHVIGYDMLAVSKKTWAAMKPTRPSTPTPPNTTSSKRKRSSSSRRKASRSIRRTRTPSANSRRRSISTNTPVTGRRARSKRSTRSSSPARQ